jgi:hypothetical protein
MEQKEMIACCAGHEGLDLIEFLLDQGINVNRRGGFVMFCQADYFGRSKVIKFLLDRDDVDPNLPDFGEHT